VNALGFPVQGVIDDAPHRSLPSSSRAHSLVKNEKGAVMLMGIYFCILLMALVFYVLGLTQTMLSQEGMQDAADAASFASAIVHARGMNLLVYINWVMAALVAVLIAIRLVQSLFIIAATLLSALAFVTMGATTALAGVCWEKVVLWENLYQKAKRAVFPILEGLHMAENAVKYVVPAAATLEALVESGKTHKPAQAVFAIPGRITLPVESDSFSHLCEKGGELVGEVVMLPITAVVGEGSVTDAIAQGVGDMAGSLSGFLCGGGKGTPPSDSRTVEKHYPEAAVQDCKTPAECASQQQDAQELKTLWERGRPASDGQCPRARQDESCPEDDPYERYAMVARSYCSPQPGFRPKKYDYVLQSVKSTYEMRATGRYELKREVLKSELVEEQSLPCRDLVAQPMNRWSDYDRKGFVSGARYPYPVCTSNEVGIGGRAGAGPVTITHTIVGHVFGCIVEEVVNTPLAKPGESLTDGSDERSPMKVKDKLELGADDFQIRAVAYSDAVGPGKYAEGVRIALHRKEKEGDAKVLTGALSFLDRFSVAQAEYYFDHDGNTDPKEWLWEARWTARLRRFRLPEQGVAPSSELNGGDSSSAEYGGLRSQSLEESCGDAGGDHCGEAGSILARLQEGVLH